MQQISFSKIIKGLIIHTIDALAFSVIFILYAGMFKDGYVQQYKSVTNIKHSMRLETLPFNSFQIIV